MGPSLLEYSRRYAFFFGLGFSALAIGAMFLLMGGLDPHPRLALDTFNRQYNTKATRLDTCTTCHITQTKVNAYGEDVKTEITKDTKSITKEEMAALLSAALTRIEERDSDGDGYSNIQEISSKTFPGDQTDNPPEKP